jgi:hypothetical protein
MGGMFNVVKVRDDLAPDDYRDPGWFTHPTGSLAQRISTSAGYGNPARRPTTAT